jgi:hypothetical protein
MASSFFDNEKILVDMLTACNVGCVVQGVPDYWAVQEFGGQYSKDWRPAGPSAALFVWYSGYRADRTAPGGCCIEVTQQYNIAVVTKNLCDLRHGVQARVENGVVFTRTFDCLNAACDADACLGMVLVTPPNFPIPLDDNGVITTFLAVEMRYLPNRVN